MNQFMFVALGAFVVFAIIVTAANLLKKHPACRVEQCPDCKCDLQEAKAVKGLKQRWLECPCKHIKRLERHDKSQREALAHTVQKRTCFKCAKTFISRNGEVTCRDCRGVMETIPWVPQGAPRDNVVETIERELYNGRG